MPGLITLLDGPAGCGKTTFACGLPAARAMLDHDVDGARWLRDQFAAYEMSRDLTLTRRLLLKWADDPALASIVVDNYAYRWQQRTMQVLDTGGNVFRAWGPAKMDMKRDYDPLVRAKKAGKHVLLTAHTKDALKVDEEGGKTSITKLGEKADCEAAVSDLLDLHLRFVWDVKRDARSLTVVKCRPQRDFKRLLPATLVVKTEESRWMNEGIREMMGEAPPTEAAVNGEQEDASTQEAMREAANAARR